MSFVECFDPGPRGLWLVLTVIVQVTVVILAAAIVSGMSLRRRAAMHHRVWLCALACTLIAPATVVLADRVGLTLPIIPWGRAATEVQPPGPAQALVEPNATAFSEPEPEMPTIRSLQRVTPTGGDGAIARALPLGDGGVRGPSGPGGSESRNAREPGDSTAEPTLRVLPAVSVSESRAGGDVGRAFLGAMTIAWALGVLIGLGRFAIGWHRVRALRRSLRPFDADKHRGALDEARDALNHRALPPIATSAVVAGPVAIGLFKPIVVLPQDLATRLNSRELRDVLIHECAHVLRRDVLVGMFQRLAAVFYWPHPLVHYMNSRLARAREEVCDNFVLRCGDPCGYARMLLELTERCRPGAAACAGIGLMDTRWTLEDRIAGLLDPRRDTMIKPNRRAAGVAALMLVVTCLGIAGVRPAGPLAAEAPPVREAQVASPTTPERIIRGIVVDEKGRPVAQATVQLVRREKAPEPAKTAANGRFELVIDGFMLMEEELVASAENGALMGLGKHVEPQNSDPAEPVRIILKPSRVVAVQVRDRAGKPVAGAAVEAVGFDFDEAATTGASGEVTIRIPADAEVHWIIGLKAGVGFDYFENDRARPAIEVGPPKSKVTLTLDGARTVRIKAVDSSGRPVPNVEFQPWTIQRLGKVNYATIGGAAVVRARTNEEGIATFDWLPTDVEREVPFLISLAAYSCRQSPVYRPETGQTELEARLLRNTPIRGFVRQPDGRPASGILIRAEGHGASNRYCRMHTRTAPDGSYSLAVYPNQSYIIAVLDDQQAARGLTGIVVREGQPREGLDFTLGEGIFLHGRVTKEPEGTPIARETITLVQRGEALPKDLIWIPGGERTETLLRWAKTDADGRYRFRVGPGHYQLWGLDYSKKEELKLDAAGELVRDFKAGSSAERAPLAGVAIEEAPSGDRPIDGAFVEASSVGRPAFKSWAAADSKGRFRISVNPGNDVVLYVRDRNGTIAGFTVVKADADDVRAAAKPASRLRGRVVDARARPRSGRQVRLRLDSAPDHRETGQFFAQAVTDAMGRYDFPGVVVGARADVSVSHSDNPVAGGEVEIERIDVRSPDPLEIPDLVVPSAQELEPRAKQPAASRTPAVVTSRPDAPTRAEVEALVRTIGRDSATPGLVDRAWLLTRPQFRWFVDLGHVRSLVADPDFTGRVDEAARSALGRPADTLTLLRQALLYHVGYDVETMKSLLIEHAKSKAKPTPTVRGIVVEAVTGRPIAGAIVYTSDALARTDDSGAFSLKPLSPQGKGMIWVEADGFAMADNPALQGAGDAVNARVELVREAPIVGRVVGRNDRPISEAIVRAWVEQDAFLRPRPEPMPGRSGFGFPLDVHTDADGRFAFHGLPPGLDIKWYEVRHPEHQSYQGERSPLKAGATSTFGLEPGCKVAGIVVDEQGHPIARARVEIRKPGRAAFEFLTHTANDGRFRFGGVTPGRRMVVVQPERQAPLYVPVVATQERPVDNQYVVGPGSYISGKVIGPDDKPVAGAAVGWALPVDAQGFAIDDLEVNRMTTTAEDGTFRLGPLSQGDYRLTSMISQPRWTGQAKARSNGVNALIRLEPNLRR